MKNILSEEKNWEQCIVGFGDVRKRDKRVRQEEIEFVIAYSTGAHKG